MNKQVLSIIEQSKQVHNTKNGLFLEKYINYYNLPVKDNFILYESFCGQGIIDNPYALFQAFMKRSDFSDYQHIWVVDNFEDKWYQIMEYSIYPNVRFIKYGSDEYLKYLSISKYLINNCTFPTYFTKKAEQIYINTWHGITIKKLGFDVPNSRLSMGNTIRNFLSSDYILSANDHMTNVFLHSYKLDGIYNGKIIQEGQPRNDLSFIERSSVIDKLRAFGITIEPDKKIILYAPTWSGTLSHPKPIDFDKINNIIDKSKYQLLCKLHHVNYQKKKECIPVAMDTNELLSICDYLITDYSSIAFDMMMLGKPVIFYMPDYDEYKKNQGLYFNWQQNIVYNLDTLKVYLQHLELLKNERCTLVCCADKILSMILDNSNGRIISADTNKEKLLFYIGDLKPNGVTTSFMSLAETIDYNRYDVSLIVLNKKDTLYQHMINQINPNVRVLCRAGTYAQTLLEECAKDITLKYGIETEYLNNLLPRQMYTREWKRCFGNAQFDKLINFTGYSPFYSYLFMIANGEKIIWQHNDMIADRERAVNGKMPLYDTLTAVFSTYPYYDKLISASKEIMKINQLNFPHIPQERFYYAHNTLNFQRILKLSQLDTGIHVNPLKVNFVTNGRLSHAKNHKALIEAFNEFAEDLTDCELYIIGDGELRDSLSNIAGEHVHLVGYQENPFFLMSQCDCFVFPSLYEGQGIALLEARVLGLPIVVSDLPKMKGIFIKDGQFNIGGFTKEHILQGLYAFIESKVPVINFDANMYNTESYDEFESVISDTE